MHIGRLLVLLLLSLTLGLSGPLARGLSLQAQTDPAVTAAPASASINSARNTGAKNCQRGVLRSSACSADIGYPPARREISHSGSVLADGATVTGMAESLRASRIFRPPRLG